MPDQASAKPAAVVVETIPSVAGEISAIASAQAPFLYADIVSACVFQDGILRITLEATRDNPKNPREVIRDRVIVAHLRIIAPAALVLRDAMVSQFGPPTEPKETPKPTQGTPPASNIPPATTH